MDLNTVQTVRRLSTVLNSSLEGRPAVRSAERCSAVQQLFKVLIHSCEQIPWKLDGCGRGGLLTSVPPWSMHKDYHSWYKVGYNCTSGKLNHPRDFLNPDSQVSWEAPESRLLACTIILDINGMVTRRRPPKPKIPRQEFILKGPQGKRSGEENQQGTLWGHISRDHQGSQHWEQWVRGQRRSTVLPTTGESLCEDALISPISIRLLVRQVEWGHQRKSRILTVSTWEQ